MIRIRSKFFSQILRGSFSSSLLERIRNAALKVALGCELFLIVTAGHVCFSQSREAIEKTELGNLQNYYATQDPHYAKVVAQLPNVESVLNDLKILIATTQTEHPGVLEAEFANCLRAINTALRRTSSARQSSAQPQYGNVRALLSMPGEDDENRLAKALECLSGLNNSLRTAAIAEAATRLERLTWEMQQEFEQIDEASAKKKAKAVLRRVVPTGIKNQATNSVTGSCENIDLEQAGFKVRDIRIDDPFGFLPWVKARERRASDQIVAMIKGKPFTYDQAAAKALDIIETENFLPDTSDQRIKLRVEIVSVENCTGGEVDLVYRVYSTQIMPVLSARPEARITERQTPQTAAGQTTVLIRESGPVHFTPTGGYDSTDLLYGGGRLEITPRQMWKLPFKSMMVEGQGSSRMHFVSAALEGSIGSATDSSRWLAHAQWLLAFTNYSLPTGVGQIKGGHLTAQFAGVTKPFGGGNFTFRFGGSLDGGNRQSDVQTLVLPSDTVPSAGFGTLKLYTGLDSRLSHNVMAFSYGLELGSVGPATRVDWRKHIIDARHEFWYPLGDHRLLDLESRFTLGSIQVPGKIPLPETFFGGNNEEFLIAGDSWQIRANPVIRAIPASKFFRTADGAGSKHFVSYNLTAAYGIWRKSLVPRELTTDPEFNSELQGAITTVTSTLQNYYASQDPHFKIVLSQLPAVQTALEELKATVASSQVTHPGQSPELFKSCMRAVSGALRRIGSAITPQGSDQYGLVSFLLSDDPEEIQLVKVNETCRSELSAAIGDAAIATASVKVANHRSALVREFEQIDQSKAENTASDDMAFTRRTLNTLFKEVNIYSLSPVFVFDVARIGPSGNGVGGTRYGPGAGIRLELASVAHFTLGYAWNVKQGAGEGKGNVFFSIGIRDLFH